MTEKTEFKVYDVLGVASGILIDKMDGIYEVISYFAGRPVFTHEIPVLHERAADLIYSKYPALKTEDVPAGKPEAIPAYKERLISRYGLELSLDDLAGKLDMTGSHKLLEGKNVIGVVL